MKKVKRFLLPLIAFVLIGAFFQSCKKKKEKDALKGLVKDLTTKASEVEAAGRVLEFMSVLEQAEHLDSTKQCKAAAKIYCALFQMARDGCNDGTSVCDEIAKSLYGGSFPYPGMSSICVAKVESMCTEKELFNHKQSLQQICLELSAQCR
ncbi:hypothetical protein [Algibacter mikhailovii]|uniref:hypothetical protein n=1 Tax=Algibacter mikhailovii TaxID=425498 RepID=UPI002494DAC4|nr:hypothetical protein [Algibacter mikhailovii]